jgi:dihydrofolate reductase
MMLPITFQHPIPNLASNVISSRQLKLILLICQMLISLIVVADEKNAIGLRNQLLCHLPADLKYFKAVTSGHHIVMGRKTYESIGRPLPNRTNIVISSNAALKIEGCVVVSSIEEAIELAKLAGETELFITGGGTIYKQALQLANKVYLTRIFHQFEADTFFPDLGTSWELAQDDRQESDEKNPYPYSFQVYQKKG